MVRKTRDDLHLAPRATKGRAVFLHRDSGGEHETAALQYCEWVAGHCNFNGLRFAGTRQKMLELIERGGGVDGDLFLDWNISGNVLDRDALEALFAEVERDRSISHVFIARPDRLARPDEIEKGIALERRFRQTLGVTLVFQTRTCAPIPIGETMHTWEFMQAAMDYAQAGAFRRELALKMLFSQRELASKGFSCGGRANYGFHRVLVTMDGQIDRPLRDGETVRSRGYHVAWVPRDDETFIMRMRIKRELLTMTAGAIAKRLNAEGIPPPDAGRMRRDNGTLHKTLGVWHATTITNIGNALLDSGTVTQGTRSMGDQLRHSAKGPRPLVQTDFLPGKRAKVIQNPEEEWTKGTAHFNPTFTVDEQTKLSAILKERGGTQRGKPRSQDPDNNPLGGRIFDMNCGWLMYRTATKHNASYTYRCGAYTQSQGDICGHNQVNGPSAVEFVLSVIREKVLSQDRLRKLIDKVRAVALEKAASLTPALDTVAMESELEKVRADLDRGGDNLALAQNDAERALIRRSLDRWLAREKDLVARIDAAKTTILPKFDVEAEVAAAMKGLSTLTDMAHSTDGCAATRDLIAAVDAKIFLQFGEGMWGKRTVRKLIGGIVTMGAQHPPIKIYQGPTDRRSLKQAKKETAALSAAVLEGSVPSELVVSREPHQEGDSSGKLHRGDRI